MISTPDGEAVRNQSLEDRDRRRSFCPSRTKHQATSVQRIITQRSGERCAVVGRARDNRLSARSDQVFNRSKRSRLRSMERGDSTSYLEEPVKIHFLALFLSVSVGAVAAEQNKPPRLIALGCNFDGGITWLALGKARANFELDSFHVEIPDVDLERVDATISPLVWICLCRMGRVLGGPNQCFQDLDRAANGGRGRKRQRGHRSF